ncbi:MAG: acyltransferase family protein [Polyangiaceae bacterium]
MSTSPSGSTSRHLPALDGLRGLALLGVLFFHANGLLTGGYLGVDLFFVLSGFLITSLLLSEQRRHGHITLSAFWVRRARRLFPALLSLMPAIAIYSHFFAKREELREIRGDALATLAYVANWRTIFSHQSYWDLFTAPSPLEHTWSLSIEEQFYVVWPLLVVLVLRLKNARALLYTSLALAALSIGAMLMLFDPENVSRVYLGTDTRATAILLGAILACVLRMDATFSKAAILKLDVLGFASAIFLGAAWWSLDGQDPRLYHGGFWLTEIASLSLIACCVAGPESIVARVLSIKPLTFIGTISYGLYLWHWPVDVFLNADRVHRGGLELVAIQFAVTFAIAIASYRFLEQPIRTRGVPFGRPLVIVPIALVLAIFMVVRATHARPLPPPAPVVLVPPPAPDKITFQILLLGDSTANSLGWGLRGVQRKGVAVENRGQDGCTMLADTCGGEKWFGHIKEVHPNATLLFVGGAFLHGLTLNGRWSKACTRGWDDKLEKNMSKRLSDLADAASDTNGEVWVVTLPDPLGPYDSAPYRKEIDCINESIRKVAAGAPTVRVLELGAHVCPAHECTRELNGKTIRPDGVHYDIDGARELSRWVLDQVGAPEPPPEILDAGSVDQDSATAHLP